MRSTTAYVSPSQRTRVHQGNYVRGEKFTLTANFNACLNGATISSVTWKTNETQAAILSSAAISGSNATVLCEAGVGAGTVKCQVTLSDGSKHNQLFEVLCEDGPWYSGETVSSGSSSLSA